MTERDRGSNPKTGLPQVQDGAPKAVKMLAALKRLNDETPWRDIPIDSVRCSRAVQCCSELESIILMVADKTEGFVAGAEQVRSSGAASEPQPSPEESDFIRRRGMSEGIVQERQRVVALLKCGLSSAPLLEAITMGQSADEFPTQSPTPEEGIVERIEKRRKIAWDRNEDKLEALLADAKAAIEASLRSSAERERMLKQVLTEEFGGDPEGIANVLAALWSGGQENR